MVRSIHSDSEVNHTVRDICGENPEGESTKDPEIDMRMEVVMDLQVVYVEDKKKFTPVVDAFKLHRRVAGENNENLRYILDNTQVEMIVQTQPTGIQDGIQFTLQHDDINGLEKSEGLLFMLLIEIKKQFENYMIKIKCPDAVKLLYKNNRARCGICGICRTSAMEDFVKHVKCHDAKEYTEKDKHALKAETGTDHEDHAPKIKTEPCEPNNNDATTKTPDERSSSPSGRKRKRSHSPLRKKSLSPRSRSPHSPPRKQKVSPAKDRFQKPKQRCRSRSKEGCGRSYSPEPSNRSRSRSASSSVSSHSVHSRSDWKYEERRSEGRKEENSPRERFERSSAESSPSSQEPKAVRDLLERGLGKRLSRYSDITDEMLLYPKVNEPHFVAQVRKYILLSGRSEQTLDNKSAQTVWWMLTFRNMTPAEKEALDEKVAEATNRRKNISQLTLQLEVVCDFYINRCNMPRSNLHSEPYQYQLEPELGNLFQRLQQVKDDLRNLGETKLEKEQKTDAVFDPDPGEYDKGFGDVTNVMIQSYHPAEPESVALARRYFLLLDRRDGRLKDEKTAKIISNLQSPLSAIEEKAVSDMYKDTCRQLAKTVGISTSLSLTIQLKNICDFLVIKARENKDSSKYPHLEHASGRGESRNQRTPTSLELERRDNENIQLMKRSQTHLIPQEKFSVSTNSEELNGSKNGQYALNTEAEKVKIHAMIWIDNLREQNKITANYTVAPWTEKIITLYLGDEEHTAEAKTSKSSPKPLNMQLKQQVALKALMNTSYSFKKIPASLQSYVTENKMTRVASNVCINEDGDVMTNDSTSATGSISPTEEVTSTMQSDRTCMSDAACSASQSTLDVIQSNLISQSTSNIDDRDDAAMCPTENDEALSVSTKALNSNTNNNTCEYEPDEDRHSEEREDESGKGMVIIKRTEMEIKAKKYLQQFEDSETDEQTENVKRLAELESSLTENDKIKISKQVEKSLTKLKEEVEWTEVPIDVEIRAKLEVTCKYILQMSTARQLAAAAKQKSPSIKPKPLVKRKVTALKSNTQSRAKTITKSNTLGSKTGAAVGGKSSTSKSTTVSRKTGAALGKTIASKATAVHNRTVRANAIHCKSGASKSTVPNVTNANPRKVSPKSRSKNVSQRETLTQRQKDLSEMAEEFIKQQEESKLTELEEARKFDALFNNLRPHEMDVVNTKIDMALDDIKAEIRYTGTVPTHVRRCVQLEVVCRYVLDELCAEPKPTKPAQSVSEIALPCISELEPETSKEKSMRERLAALEKTVRLTLETRQEGLMTDECAKEKITSIKRDIIADNNEINRRLNLFMTKYLKTKRERCPPSERITEHFRITCNYVLKKFRDAVKHPAQCQVEYV